MIGLGIGGDVLDIKRDKMYMEGSVGIGCCEEYEEGIRLCGKGVVERFVVICSWELKVGLGNKMCMVKS